MPCRLPVGLRPRSSAPFTPPFTGRNRSARTRTTDHARKLRRQVGRRRTSSPSGRPHGIRAPWRRGNRPQHRTAREDDRQIGDVTCPCPARTCRIPPPTGGGMTPSVRRPPDWAAPPPATKGNREGLRGLEAVIPCVGIGEIRPSTGPPPPAHRTGTWRPDGRHGLFPGNRVSARRPVSWRPDRDREAGSSCAVPQAAHRPARHPRG